MVRPDGFDSPDGRTYSGPLWNCESCRSSFAYLDDAEQHIRERHPAPDPNHEPGLSECGCRNCDPGRYAPAQETPPAPGHVLVMRGTIALRDAEIELLRERLADAEYQRDRWIADAASWERRAAERDRFWNALFYIAHRTPDYVPYAGPECVQVAKDAIDGSEQPPAAPELTTPEKP